MAVWRKLMSSFLEEANCATVTAELLGEVLEMHAAMPAEDRGVFEARAVRLFKLLDRKGLGDKRATLAMAIDFRLQALARLQMDSALRGWSMRGDEPGKEYIHADMLKAAAEERIIENEAKQADFDAES